MIDQEIQAYCRRKGFHDHTEARWLGLSEADREALFGLARDLKAGENHLKDILEWVEEIALRDGTGLAALLQGDLSSIATDPRLGRNDKLKRLKDELKRRRFPRLALIEDEIHRRVRALKLDPKSAVSVPAGLEGGAVTVKIQATSQDDLKRLVDEMARAVDTDAMREIFSLLKGEGID
ncbi:MAG TPA: hypothetical protein VGA73_11570 [Candidatus Binatia bacterium]